MKHANVLISLCVVLVVSGVVAYLYLGPKGSGGSDDLERRVNDLESRVSEQLVIVGYPAVDEQEIRFVIMHIGTAEATISKIRVDNIFNSSSPGWIGNRTLIPGQTGYITLYGLKYLANGFTEGDSYQFIFITARGNSFYCVVKYGENEEIWGKAGAILSVSNVRYYNSSGLKVDITIRNSGTADAKVVEVYQGTSSSNLQLESSPTYDPTTQLVSVDSSLKITFSLSWADGTRYYFKVVTEAGQILSFSEEA